MRYIALVLLAMTAASVCLAETVTVRVDRSAPYATSRLSMGVTHTKDSLDPWGDAAAVERGKALLKAACRFQNQHVMGWGAGNPEPSPGVYDWESLDRRVALIRSMGVTPVITLCAAPDWMKGGEAGKTDWSKIEVAPLPEHFGDFAELARQVARRYPDVRYYQVWNEFKGLWDGKANNWDYRAYTELYNKVYDALKSVNPAIKVGGPYLVIEGTGTKRGDWANDEPIRARQWEVLSYWLKNKHGADFIAIDRGIVDAHDRAAYTDAEIMALTPWFERIARQIRAKTDLPLWWAEYYGAGSGDREYVRALYASILLHMLNGGTSVALLWQPQDDGGELTEGLFTDTRRPGGGQPLPFYDAFRAFHQHFAPGAPLFRATSSSPDVEALASDKAVLLVNKRPEAVTVVLDGKRVELGRYGVTVVEGR